MWSPLDAHLDSWCGKYFHIFGEALELWNGTSCIELVFSLSPTVSISLISGTVPQSIHPIRGKIIVFLCFFSCCPDKIPFPKWLKCEVCSVAQFKGTAIIAGKSKRQELEGVACTWSQVAETNKRWCSAHLVHSMKPKEWSCPQSWRNSPHQLS